MTSEQTGRASAAETVRGWVRGIPQLDRDERRELVDRLEEGGRGDPDYVIMMILSSALASLGLIEGSVAVIIGAMLVAPLMGPLVAAGIAIVQANVVLYKRSLGVIGLGVAIGLGVSLVTGLVNPGFEVSVEVESRAMPDLFDLAVAGVSGMAAAYAQARPKVVATLAGVAIAAALVPPLAVVGIALTNGHPVIAGYAAILLATNVVAIIVGSALVFRLMGVHKTTFDKLPAWARRAMMFLIMGLVLLLAPLVLNMLERRRQGRARPLTYPVAPHVREAIRDFVEPWPAIQIVYMGRDSAEPHTAVGILLSTSEPLPAGFETALTSVVREVRGDAPKVNVWAVAAAEETPLTGTGTTPIGDDG